ncbi:MAG: RdgB/HAM1 family non-canonical purine NTP pyrophosphatase [Oscillospiraceae bacterium]
MKFIIATNNKHKVKEFQRILSPLGIEVISQSDAGINIDVVEDADSFEGNAYLKAKAIFDISHIPTISDDSGLEVFALNNAPGVFSARYGGAGLTDIDRYNKLLDEMKNIPEDERGARFICSISLVFSNVKSYSFTGVCQGKIGYQPKGQNGFGYDPVFMIGDESFSTLSPQKKDEISHRGKALRQMAEELKNLKNNE